jgi:hypothetical protein
MGLVFLFRRSLVLARSGGQMACRGKLDLLLCTLLVRASCHQQAILLFGDLYGYRIYEWDILEGSGALGLARGDLDLLYPLVFGFNFGRVVLLWLILVVAYFGVFII